MQRHESLLYGVLLISSVLRVQGGQTITNKPGPVITYSCTNRQVTTIHISGGSFDHVRLLKDKTFCEPSPTDDKGVLGCITTLQGHQNAGTNVTILYEKSTHQGTTGGKITRFFLLNCDEKSTMKKAELASMNVAPSEFPLTKLGIDVSSEPQLTVQGSSADIYVGKKITLQMTIDAQYKLLPTTCSAYKSDQDGAPYKFWTKCDNGNDKAIISEQLWTPGTKQLNTIATIEMYAFRFTNQPAIIIKCETWVCPAKAKECDLLQCPGPVIGRKKRDVNGTSYQKNNVTTATASIALDVFESRKFRENGSQALSPVWYIYAAGFGIIYWTTLKEV